MSPKLLKEMQHLQKALSKNSWTNYLRLMGSLSRVYQDDYPYVKELVGYLRSGLIHEAVALADSLEEQSYSSATQHFVANQFVSLVKKYPFPAHLNPFKPEQVARDKFLAAEAACLYTNKKLSLIKGDLEASLHRMRSFIRYVLGDEPPLKDIYSKCDFGPGASIGVHGNATNVKQKIASRWTVSPSAFHYAFAAVTYSPHLSELLLRSAGERYYCYDPNLLLERFRSRVSIVDYNKIAFVPKTVKTHRSIAVEPLLNSYLQKGVDVFMRERLRRIGIDLSDQSKNSEFARRGSLMSDSDGLSTIDLSSASDSISIELCRELLPPEWFAFLNSLRSTKYMDGGRTESYNKFCSMGNGFCFPLETLIFAAACVSCDCGEPGVDFLVYGDDIVVSNKSAEAVLGVLSEIGFTPNRSKTFTSGPFRESCGRDWFLGEDVRPFILDYALDSLESMFKTLNLTRRSRRVYDFFLESRPLLEAMIPDKWRFTRPYSGPADTAYQVELDAFMSSPFARRSRDLQCWSWTELHHVPIIDRRGVDDSDVILMFAAMRGHTSAKPFTLRRQTRTTVRRVAYG